MPTPTQLQYIISVDKWGHFGHAAQECHVSQPSLSMQIQKVEEELELIIFDRAQKPIVATEKGRQFIEQAKVIMHEHQKLIEMAKSDQKILSGHFRLGIIPTIGPYLLPLFIEDLAQNYPKLNLRVDEMRTEDIVRALRAGTIDAGLLATPLAESGLKEDPLFYEPFFLYLSEDHKLVSKKKINEDDLEGSEMWLLQDGHCLRNQVVKVCSMKSQSTVFKNVQFEGGSLETLRYLIKKSKGYTIVPQLFVNMLPNREREHQVREFAGPVPSREISLIYHRNLWKTDILEALKGTIVKCIPKDIKTHLNKNKTEIIRLT